MKRSIRFKFTIIFVSLMVLAVGATWGINNWFLEEYYQNYKIDLLEEGYHAIDAIVQEEQAKGESALEGIEEELAYQSSFYTADWDAPSNGVRGRKNGPEANRTQRHTESSEISPGSKGESDAGTQSRSDAGNGSSETEKSANTGVERLASMVRELRDTSNITLLIYDSIKDQTLVSSTRDMEILRDRVRQYIVGRSLPGREILEEHENYVIQKTFDPRSQTFYLESWGFFSDNSTIFIMTTPMDSIRESAAISNRFLMYVGLTVILAGSIAVYFITKRMTAPIHRLSQLSEKMSNLDFDAKYVEPKDSTAEIDTLGNSMNAMSDKLKMAIDDLRAANSQLQKDIEEKIQIDEMRKEFIANVSHELKTPIALIQGYAEGLVEGMAEEKESRDYYCEVIMDEATKMNRMVKQLLTLTALEFGREELAIAPFDLNELIRGVTGAVGLVAEQKGIRTEFDAGEALWVKADEFKIEEVITNYFNNAVNHAEGEKKITITAERIEDGHRAKVTVFNTGKPIPEEDLPNLWTKFYKVDKARTRAYGGSGIGLSIVKAIMESHHQEYGVENREDGVAFWFTLEYSDEKEV